MNCSSERGEPCPSELAFGNSRTSCPHSCRLRVPGSDPHQKLEVEGSWSQEPSAVSAQRLATRLRRPLSPVAGVLDSERLSGSTLHFETEAGRLQFIVGDLQRHRSNRNKEADAVKPGSNISVRADDLSGIVDGAGASLGENNGGIRRNQIVEVEQRA